MFLARRGVVSPFILAEEDKEQLNRSLGLCWVWKETSGTALALSTAEAEGGGSGVRGQPGLCGEPQSHSELATFLGTVTELLMETM